MTGAERVAATFAFGQADPIAHLDHYWGDRSCCWRHRHGLPARLKMAAAQTSESCGIFGGLGAILPRVC